MALTKHTKIHLSTQLENEIFNGVLKKSEVLALRERCESYQAALSDGGKSEWKQKLYRAYTQYFGFLSALKVKSSLEELFAYNYLKVWKENPIRIIDFGAGTFGATLGALDFFDEHKLKCSEVIAIDADHKPMTWAQNDFSQLKKQKIKFRSRFPIDLKLENTLVIAVDVFNEVGLMEETEHLDPQARWLVQVKEWIEHSDDSTLFLFIEPAGKLINRNFLRFRDELSERASILLPCTHQQNCPALQTNDWCHEDRAYKAPSKYWNLVHQMGFERRVLSYSMLCLGKQKPIFTTSEARVVSRKLKSKGRCDKWLCGNGKRWKATLLKRNENESNKDYFEAIRGDIVDCRSTGIKEPD